MISKSIINACLAAGKVENKDTIIRELLNHVAEGYDYNDKKGSHVLEMLVDKNSVVTLDKVNVAYVINNPNILTYKNDETIIKNVSVANIDNIEGTVCFEFDYKNKKDEENKDIDYNHSIANISYIENPEILK